MRFTVTILLVASLHVCANGYGQDKITLSEKNAPLQKVVADIQLQTKFNIWYDKTQVPIDVSITMDVREASLEEVLNACCKNQDLEYSFAGTMVVLRQKNKKFANIPSANIDVKGKVITEKGEPAAGVSVFVRGTDNGTMTDKNGEFQLSNVDEHAVLVITGTNIETFYQPVKSQKNISIAVKKKVNDLDEVQVIGYGQTTKRYTTGDISTVTSKTIESQPVSDPLAALEGRVAGLDITQGNGVAGSAFTVRIRGQNSIAAGNDPYYVVDGVPFISTPLNSNINFTGLTTANGFTSPFNSINPEDIESVTILKDADATAIYGSRGSNGVILITTKKGKSGKLRAMINIYSGVEKNEAYLPVLNTPQYLALRHNAFDNDGVVPTPENALDLMVWDTTKYTDWQKYVTGKTASVTDVQADLSGGSDNIRFLFGINYRNEGSVYAGDYRYHRYGGHLNTEFNSTNRKFGGSITITYTKDQNILPPPEQGLYFQLPPDFPLKDSTGALVWTTTNNNPLAFSLMQTNFQTSNLVWSSQLYYKLTPDLTIRSSFGYTTIDMQQMLIYPASLQNPNYSPVSYSQFGEGSNQTVIVEPQIDYSKTFGSSNLHVLVGGSWQDNTSKSYNLTAQYSNEDLMEFLGAASAINGYYNTYAEYKYVSLFSRINYDLKNRYLLTLSFRRDGSSRFGPDKQFGNFGAVGVGWIFSDESFIKNNLSFLSFGKLRGSYGITGNDQIPDYQYLSSYNSNSSTLYGGVAGLQPYQAANPDFSWEINKKLEAAIELGFLKDRIMLTTSWYRNRSSNQLVSYPLAIQSGFSGYEANLPAVVQNQGWEFELSTINIKNERWSWKSSIVLSLPQNKLLQYPGLAASPFANLYVVGQSLNIVKGFHFQGINPSNGVPQFTDINKDGFISYPEDLIVMGQRTPQYYGGVNNAISYKSFELSFFFQFVKQMGYNYNFLPPVPVGFSRNNVSDQALQRWQKPGDITNISGATTTAGSDIFNAFFLNYSGSDAAFSDASFIRLKNVSLAYHLPQSWMKAIGLQEAKIYLLAQNLLTITHYFGFDPETQNQSVGPLRTLTAGIHVNF